MSGFKALDADKLRQQGTVVLDRMARYWEGLTSQRPSSDVQPGYLERLLPKEAPYRGEELEEVMRDFDRVVMPGVTHWHSTRFYSYFPTGNSVPSILADIISGALGIIGFSWDSSPACTELEVLMMKWLGRLLGLPECFYEGPEGGGIIQGTASEATLVALLAARSKAIKLKGVSDPNKMVAYFSQEAHSSVERAAMLLLVQSRKVGVDSTGSMCAEALKGQIEADLAQGLTPIMCVATIGTTSICYFDRLDILGPVCRQYGLWLHVDAAYAGSALVCPEFRYLIQGVELVDSFNMNAHKWLMVNMDCSCLWMKESNWMVETFKVDPLYMQHTNQAAVSDFRHWQIPLGRRFRSLKLWFVLRMVGVEGLREYIRKDIKLAKSFEALVLADDEFEVVNEVVLSLVCFRLKSGNDRTRELASGIEKDGRLFMRASQTGDVCFLRFVISSSLCEQVDVHYAWDVIKEIANKLKEEKIC